MILLFLLPSCNSEKNEIVGNWFYEQHNTWYHVFKDGTYRSFVYEPVSSPGVIAVLRSGSAGYYQYSEPGKFNLYELDVDLSPILGKSVTDADIARYVNDFMNSHEKPDLKNTIPSFRAQIQSEGEHLHILHNDVLIIELSLRHTEFGDKR